MTVVERAVTAKGLRQSAADARANPKGYQCYDSEGIASYFERTAEQMERIEGAVDHVLRHTKWKSGELTGYDTDEDGLTALFDLYQEHDTPDAQSNTQEMKENAT